MYLMTFPQVRPPHLSLMKDSIPKLCANVAPVCLAWHSYRLPPFPFLTYLHPHTHTNTHTHTHIHNLACIYYSNKCSGTMQL